MASSPAAELVTMPAVVRPESVMEVLPVKVVNVPAAAVPPPMAPGFEKVAPFKEEAFKLGTLVVEATTNGAVPVASVEVSWPLMPMVVMPPKEVEDEPREIAVVPTVMLLLASIPLVTVPVSPVVMTVPETFGKVQVLSAPVKSAEVMMPLKEAVAVVVCGLICRVSVLAVDEPKMAAPVPFRVWVIPIFVSVPRADKMTLPGVPAAALAIFK